MIKSIFKNNIYNNYRFYSTTADIVNIDDLITDVDSLNDDKVVKIVKTIPHIVYFDLDAFPFRREIDLITIRDFYVNFISTLKTSEKHMITLKNCIRFKPSNEIHAS